MRLKKIDISGFKSFGKSYTLILDKPITGVVGPNGSGKSNVVEALRFALGEQSIKSLRGGQSTDLLFKSGIGNKTAGRASVTLTFDNHDRIFQLPSLAEGSVNIAFDEISISRELYSDGVQKYLINGIPVRMRDVVELIGSVNIGSSGHHIISQGEADRFLFSSPRERRILMEEALGLKLYHYRIAETERKLEKSRDALREARLLQKELEPHLKFLRKQVEKIEQAAALRSDLSGAFHRYLDPLQHIIAGWRSLCDARQAQLTVERNSLMSRYRQTESQLQSARQAQSMPENTELDDSVIAAEHAYREALKNEGRGEVTLEHITSRQAHIKKTLEKLQSETRTQTHVAVEPVKQFLAELDQLFVAHADDFDTIVARARDMVSTFRSSLEPERDTSKIDALHQELLDLEQQLHDASQQIHDSQQLVERTKQAWADLVQRKQEYESARREEQSSLVLLERDLVEIRREASMVDTRAENLNKEFQDLANLNTEYERELAEATAMLGSDWSVSEVEEIGALDRSDIDNRLQELSMHRRTLDRVKIKLEELGIISAPEVLAEHTATEERYAFLTKEISDIDQTILDLEPLLKQLQSEVRTNFAEGIIKINKKFSEFFTTMFGGGSAEILLIQMPKRKKKGEAGTEYETQSTELEISDNDGEDDKEGEQGIDIRVRIPGKKVGELSILSGGERSLTSIALLFSLSQVNPPPFIVLDETDAALDESNSRKYGQLMRKLSEISQIIVVTHNRETMSHADVLYGVTLGSDTASQLFSIRFDDAVQYAK